MTSYHKFVNSKETHELIWKDNGRNGPNMYWHIPTPKTFADIVENNSCILGDKLPPLQESIIQTDKLNQKPETQEIQKETIKSFKQKYLKQKPLRQKPLRQKKSNKQKHINKKKKRPNINELDHNYYQKYTDGIGEDEYYYRTEKIYYDLMPWDECVQDADCECNQCYENRLFIKLKRELGINYQYDNFVFSNFIWGNDESDYGDESDYEYEDYLYRTHDNYADSDEYHRNPDDYYDDSDN